MPLQRGRKFPSCSLSPPLPPSTQGPGPDLSLAATVHGRGLSSPVSRPQEHAHQPDATEQDPQSCWSQAGACPARCLSAAVAGVLKPPVRARGRDTPACMSAVWATCTSGCGPLVPLYLFFHPHRSTFISLLLEGKRKTLK